MKQLLVPRQIGRACTVIICFILILLAVAPGLLAQRSVWPNCNFNCTAKDVALTRVYAETTEAGCTEGAPVTATIWGVFDASAARYAVWVIGDIYANGILIQRIEQCVIESITPGTTEVPLAVVTWPCGAPLEFENVVVSWAARAASCMDEPGCQERGAKCTRPTLAPIYVYPDLIIDFYADEPQCPGAPVTFTAIVSGGAAPYSYDWDFGDGSGTSAQENPQYSYTNAGSYTAQLTVSDGSGQRKAQTKLITILNSPSVFADNGGPYCEGETIELSASGGSTYDWTGPGGFISTDQNPVVPDATIGDAGTYTVYVTDSSGCVAEAATDVVVNVCQRTLTIASTNGGTVVTPGEGSFTYDVGTEVLLEAAPDPCHVFSGWVGDVDELADPGAASTFVTLERDTLLEAHFVFHDTELPTLDCPPDVIVECGDEITPESLGMATAFDACDPSPTVTCVDDETVGACPGEMTITRTWTATDAAGNSVECAQTIDVRDTTPPALTLSNQTFQCDGAGNTDDIAGWLADPIGADDCGEVVISNDYAGLVGVCPGTGTALVTFTATDACGNSTQRAATVAIVDTTPPDAGDDAATTPEDTLVTIPVLDNDQDTCGGPRVIVSVGDPMMGDAEINGDQIRYTPQMDAAGIDSFTYTVEDCSGNQDTALVEVTVTPVDDPPVAQDQSRTTAEDTATGFFSLAVSDPDDTLADLSCDCVNPPAHGAVERGANHTVNYTPDPDFAGIDTFSYEVCDPEGLCDTATVTVTVTSENDNPSVEATSQTTQEDTPVTILVTHSDLDGDPLTCVVLEPTHGTVTPASATIAGPYPQSGELVYTPDPEYHGTDNFTITCDDGKGGAATALVEITVTPVNDPPVTDGAEVQLAEDTPTPFTLTGSDIDNDPLTYALLTDPTHGEITGFDAATGEVIYTPDPNYNGEDTLTYEVCDTNGACDSAIIRLVVTPVNDLPQASPQALVTDEDTELPITLTGIDPDGDPLQFSIVSDPAHGTVSGLDPETGELVYTPNPEYDGDDAFIYEVCDDDECVRATIQITVTPIDDPPVAQDQSRTTAEDTATGFFSLAVSDPDDTLADLSCDCVNPPAHGAVERGANHTVNYTPDPDFAGIDTFSYEVCDPEELCDTATVTVTVTSENDNPSVEATSQTTQEDTPVTILVTHSDLDGDPLTCVVLEPTHGTVTPASATIAGPYPQSGELVYTPDPEYHGTDNFTITCDDGKGGAATALVEITVTPVNDPPVTDGAEVQLAEDTPTPFTLTGSDIDNDPLTYALLTDPTHGEITGFDAATGEVIYTPDPNYNGEDILTYEVCDTNGACDSAIIRLVVTPVNDLPQAAPQALVTDEDTELPITLTGIDPDGDPLQFSIVSDPAHGTVSGLDPETGELVYTPNPDYDGDDAFIYEVCDDNECVRATIRITVTPIDDAPVAQDQSRTTDEDTATGSFSLAVSDPDDTLADLSCDCVNPPAHGAVERGANHTVNYTPDPDFAGIDTFSYEVCDPEGLCDTATVTVTVTSENDNPSVEATGKTTQEDTPVTILVTHSDLDGDPLTCVVLEPTHGTVTPASATITGPYPQSGELVYTPDPEYHGTDNFTITCDDGKGGAATALVEITVTPVNDAPVAQDQARTTDEDTATGFFSLAVSDPDDALADLSCDCVNPPAHGAVERGANHTVNYTPGPDFNGIDTFSYEVCDSEGLCDTATVTVIVAPVDDPPYAHDDDATTREETAVSIDVATNDSDADVNLDLSTIVVTVGPAHGMATVDPATGVISYLPSTDFHSTDTFTYEICDLKGACDTATVTIDVTPVNDPPTTAGRGVTTAEDTPVEIVLVGDDADGDALDYSILSEPSHGEIQGFDPATGELIYRPDSDFNGQDSFVFEVCDPLGACSTATIKITVTPVNDPPVADAAEVQLAEDTPASFTLTGSDIDNDPLRYALLTDPIHGEITGFDPATGDVIYTPDPDYNGEDTLIYEVCDTSGACDSATIRLVITPVNDLPQAAPQTLVTDEDTELPITLTGTDPDEDPLQFSIVSDPAHGTVSGLDPETGELVYTPNPDYDGDDAFIYEVCDDNECVRATIRITVTPIDDAPVAQDQSRTTDEDTATGSFSLAVSDPDDTLADLSCDCVNPPAHGTVERGVNHTVNYIPDSDFAGIDTFSYEVCDPEGLCDTATVTVTVTSENDNPSVEATGKTTQEDTPVTISVTHSDPDGDPLTCVVLEPTHGTVTPASATITGPYPQSGELVYTPDPEFHGTDNFTITCDDGKGGAAIALVKITVTPVNDPPVADAAEVQLAEDTPASFTLTGSDIDNDPLRYALLTDPIHGEITGFDPATGDVIYTPDPDYNGEDTLIYEVCDTSGACDSATIRLVITPVNDLPQAAPQTLVTDEDTELPITLTGTDPDEDPLQFSIVSNPAHGTVSGLDPETGELVYTPNPDYTGIDSFIYTVCDPFNVCDTAQVTILVTPTNDPPVAISTDTIVSAGWVVPVSVNGTDSDGDRITYEIVGGPSHGALVQFNPDTGLLVYLSDTDYIGPDAVRFRVCDPYGACDEGLLQLFIVDGGGGGAATAEEERVIAISEIAWAGTDADARDEWIELVNLSSEEIDLAGWTLRWRRKNLQSDEDVQWKVVALQGIIAPGSTTAQAETSIVETEPENGIWQVVFPLDKGNGFYLMEHETDWAVSDIPADMVYEDRLSPTGTLDLADVGEVIELLDRYGTVVDTANADNPERDGWPAGSASTRGTMERTNPHADDFDWNWHTNLSVVTSGEDAHGDRLLGTARTENSPVLEDLLSGSDYRPIELHIGNTLRITVPITAAEGGSDAWPRIFVSRQGAGVETVLVETAIQIDQQPDGMNIAVPTDSFSAGEAHIWIAYVDGSVFFVPVILK